VSAADVFKNSNIKINRVENIKEELGIKEIGDETKPVMLVSKAVEEQAVREALIPYIYEKVEYDRDYVKKSVEKVLKMNKRAMKIFYLDKYLDLLDTIVGGIRAGKKPSLSYIIGAPNGFGKATFANTLIKIMFAHGWKVAPYVSLVELAEIRLEAENRLMNSYYGNKSKLDKEDFTYESVGGVYKEPQVVITNKFSWSEYLSTDVLVVHMTDVSSKQIESSVLKSLLDIRGVKGLPTIVMTANSLNPYTKDNFLGPKIWDDILSKEPLKGVYDRLYHVSTYKMSTDII